MKSKTADELGNKLAALIMLTQFTSKLILPTYEEWLGFNALDRDDELPSLPGRAGWEPPQTRERFER
jgi:hypothetical protein